MPAGSELLVLENVLPYTGAGLILAYLDVLMLTGWGGRERTLAEYHRLLAGVGLHVSQAWPLEARTGLTAVSARHVT
jgi:hypothetical protein